MSKRRHQIRSAIGTVLSALIMISCAATSPPTEDEKSNAYAPLRSNPFVPVNVYLNRRDWVNQNQVIALKYLQEQLEKTEAFARIDFNAPRWPHTLEIRYERINKETPQSVIADIVLGGSLGIIPTNVSETHVLAVEIFEGQIPIRRMTYTEPIESRRSLLDGMDGEKYQKIAIERLLLKFIQDLETQQLLPRVKDLKKPTDQPT